MTELGQRDFAERVVLVTGAAGGIGSALARRFARSGARLALLDREAGALAELARELGPAARALPCDLRDADACRAAVRAACEQLGGLDVLVNNAGITHLSLFAETDPCVLRQVMDVNFFGAVHCTHAALPALAARRGLVVVVSSVAGLTPLAGRSGYAASKHALHGLFDSLRPELRAQGIDVLLVCPGFTATGIEAHALGARPGARPRLRTTVGRLARPEDVAEAIHRAALRRRRLVVLSPVGWLAWTLWRIAPRAYERIAARRLLKAAS